MAVRPRAYDTDDAVSISSGAVSSAGGDSGLAEGLLDATTTLTRVAVLLAEASADDWREVKPRVSALRAAIKMLPKGPPRRRRVGY